MLLCLSCDSVHRLWIFFKDTPNDTLSIYKAPFAGAITQRLTDEFGATFGKQQNDILGDDVWREGVIDGKRIEVSVTYHSGCSIRSLEPSADEVILTIAGSLAKRPIELG